MSAVIGRPVGQRAWGSHDRLVTLLALGAVLAWELSGLDLAVMRALGDAQGFSWQHHWLTERVVHGGGRVLAWGVMALLVVNVWQPFWAGPTRDERLRWLGVTVACVLLVPLLKQFSRTSCPWDLAEFGGVAVYVSHWHLGVGDGGPGRCFPSGHATAAFGFLAGWFALRDHHPRAARVWLAAVLVLGTAFGVTQTLRGAHHPSHTLWTAWLCWALGVAAMGRRRLPGRVAALQRR